MNRDRKARRDALKRRQEEQGAEHRPLTRRGLIALGGQLAVGPVLASHMRRLQIVGMPPAARQCTHLVSVTEPRGGHAASKIATADD